MGVTICCCKPKPPPDIKLIGEWILNDKSKNFHIGHGMFRYKRGTNLLGVGFCGKFNEKSVCRLKINEDGMIQFYQYTPQRWTVIDGPAYSWKNNKIKAYGHSRLDYSLQLLQSKDLLIVNGMVLKRLSTTQVT